MNTRNLLLLVLTLLPVAALGEPISLDPGAPASATLTPLPVNSNDNPLHLTLSQQYHINARKLRFQRDANAVFVDHKMNNVNKGLKVKSLEKEADKDILGMLDSSQQKIVLAAMHGADEQNHADAAHSKARHALYIQFQALRGSLMKTITPQQGKQLMQLEKASQATMQSIVADKTLSKTDKAAKVRLLSRAYLHRRDSIYTPDQLVTIKRLSEIERQAQTLR